MLDPGEIFFPVVTLDDQSNPERLLGNAFPVTSDGGLPTCRHVVDVVEGTFVGVWDIGKGRVQPISSVVTSDDLDVDLAFIPGALNRPSLQFPFITEELARVAGTDVYSVGYYSPAGRHAARIFDLVSRCDTPRNLDD